MTPDCFKIQNSMSAYFDGELAPPERALVEEHLEECDDCTRLLSEFERLSALAPELDCPLAVPSSQSFNSLAVKMDAKSSGFMRRLVIVAVASAATVLIVLVVGRQTGYFPTERSHVHETAAVRAYLREFTTDPDLAQQKLVAAYSGRKVTVDEAGRQFKHQVAASKAPPGYRIESTTVFDFPCCRCIQTVFTADDAGPVVVLEHGTEQADWFTDKSSIHVACEGVPCRLIELDGMLASTWRVASHQVTLIGLRDVAELKVWIRVLNAEQAVSRAMPDSPLKNSSLAISSKSA